MAATAICFNKSQSETRGETHFSFVSLSEAALISLGLWFWWKLQGFQSICQTTVHITEFCFFSVTEAPLATEDKKQGFSARDHAAPACKCLSGVGPPRQQLQESEPVSGLGSAPELRITVK